MSAAKFMRAASIALVFALAAPCAAQSISWAQLDLGDICDPYPDSYREIIAFAAKTTSIAYLPERKFLKPGDDATFAHPLLVLACRAAPRDLDDEEVRRLRAHLVSGGMLWVEDASGQSFSGFDRWVRRTLKHIFPESELSVIPPGHPVYRSFFLIRSPQGRVRVSGNMESINLGSRGAVVYSRNDLLGVWPKDALDNPLYPCVPGGEDQRLHAKMLALNIVMYSLTGSYKLDAVHQPFLLQKLRMREAQ